MCTGTTFIITPIVIFIKLDPAKKWRQFPQLAGAVCASKFKTYSSVGCVPSMILRGNPVSLVLQEPLHDGADSRQMQGQLHAVTGACSRLPLRGAAGLSRARGR